MGVVCHTLVDMFASVGVDRESKEARDPLFVIVDRHSVMSIVCG
jgi:hypothetical protein